MNRIEYQNVFISYQRIFSKSTKTQKEKPLSYTSEIMDKKC